MTFNPLTAADPKTAEEIAEDLAPSRPLDPSYEPAAEPAPPPKFYTKIPAVTPITVRRFSLNDLPRYADKLYPVLKEMYPHLNERMYGGWLRGCIADNSCLFVVVDGAVLMAHIMHWPMNPIPFIWKTFMLGDPGKFALLYEYMIKWAREVGANEIYCRGDDLEFLRKFKDCKGEKYTMHILHV